MEYELLAPSTSPTDLATFASRTITWSALHNAIQTLLAESAIATDWFSFFRDIPRDDERFEEWMGFLDRRSKACSKG